MKATISDTHQFETKINENQILKFVEKIFQP